MDGDCERGRLGEKLNGIFVVMADLDVVVEGTAYVSVEGSRDHTSIVAWSVSRRE